MATATLPTKEERQQEYIRELVRGTNYYLLAADKWKLSGLLEEFCDTLPMDEYDMSQSGIIKQHIDTGQHPTIRLALRRHLPSHLQEIREQTELMLKQMILESSVSEWTSNCPCSEEGQHSEFSVDYRRLSEVSRKDSYPLHRIYYIFVLTQSMALVGSPISIFEVGTIRY